ncbi:MAG: DNA-binding protein [Gimesia sp.]|uniref:DNA-binding protein n=1 Tax=Gimesia maris TaxID=122 RepID=A0A3D3R2A6_9PLAN|nr:DNA-binding protein [Gimesia sp.]HCO22925.1 DNA-binding protein [Gimesia maris]
MSGEKKPTFRQLEKFASKTKAPFGYLLLNEPPKEEISIPDYRTPADTVVDNPSPNLIDTIQAMEFRQDWMREFLIERGEEKLPFIGVAQELKHVQYLANEIRKTLSLEIDWVKKWSTSDDALRNLVTAIENIGVLVFRNSIVENNTNRKLDPQEFRGFVLCDDYAPLIFVNTADTKSAQMFTLAHELVHLWLGKDGLFNLIEMMPSDDRTEKFCNRVAAEFLVPKETLNQYWQKNQTIQLEIPEIARLFKVSPIVIARRALDLKFISKPEFFEFYKEDQQKWKDQKDKDKKGNNIVPYPVVQKSRLSNRFSTAVVQATKEGKLQYRDAYRFTGFRGNSFEEFSKGLLKG